MSKQVSGWHRKKGGIEMFDKLIESGSVSSPSSRRNRYFALSGAAVAAIVIALLLFSLFSMDFEIGAAEFEMSRLLAPVAAEAPEPQPDPRREVAPVSDLPIRRINMARVDELGPIPEKTSTVKNEFRERPLDRFVVTEGPETNGRSVPAGSFVRADTTGSGSTPPPAQPDVTSAPPSKVDLKKDSGDRIIVSKVVNGLATHLPKPPYPPIALQANIKGEVNVQVMIDEAGKVVSAKAVNGHPLLKGAAEKAAWSARFQPTTISGRPVKVTGVIVYRFTRN